MNANVEGYIINNILGGVVAGYAGTYLTSYLSKKAVEAIIPEKIEVDFPTIDMSISNEKIPAISRLILKSIGSISATWGIVKLNPFPDKKMYTFSGSILAYLTMLNISQKNKNSNENTNTEIEVEVIENNDIKGLNSLDIEKEENLGNIPNEYEKKINQRPFNTNTAFGNYYLDRVPPVSNWRV